jgi:hypothetical protein
MAGMAEVFEQVARIAGWLAYLLVLPGALIYAAGFLRSARNESASASSRRWPASAWETVRRRDAVTKPLVFRAIGSLLLLAAVVAFVVEFLAYAVELTLRGNW